MADVAIKDKTVAVLALDDKVLFSDTSDSGATKNAIGVPVLTTAQTTAGGVNVPAMTSVGDMLGADGQPAGLSNKAVGTLFQRTTAKSLNSVRWAHIVNQNPFTDGSGVGGENYANEVTAIGWNLSDTVGNAATGGTAAFWDNWEYKYNIGGKYYHERHVESVDTAGVRHRVQSFAIPHDGGLGSSYLLAMDTHAWYTFDGAYIPVQWNLKANFAIFGSSATAFSFNFNKNNSAPFSQRNGANSAYLALPYYNSDDRLVIGGQVLHNADAPAASGSIGWNMNWLGTPGSGATFFSSVSSSPAGNVTLLGMNFAANCNYDLINQLRNLRSGTQYSSAVQSLQTDSSNGMAYVRTGYTSGQQWSFGMRDTQNWVLAASSNLLSNPTFTVDKTTLQASFAAPLKIPSYANVAAMPSAATYGAGSLIHVASTTVPGGAVIATPDGGAWKVVASLAAAATVS